MSLIMDLSDSEPIITQQMICYEQINNDDTFVLTVTSEQLPSDAASSSVHIRSILIVDRRASTSKNIARSSPVSLEGVDKRHLEEREQGSAEQYVIWDTNINKNVNLKQMRYVFCKNSMNYITWNAHREADHFMEC